MTFFSEFKRLDRFAKFSFRVSSLGLFKVSALHHSPKAELHSDGHFDASRITRRPLQSCRVTFFCRHQRGVQLPPASPDRAEKLAEKRSSRMLRSACRYCQYYLLLAICCFVLACSARLTEQPIDLLPTTDSLLRDTHEPRHLSGYFTVRIATRACATQSVLT